ncbi:MAG: zinc-dependent alcohol dehydrogenase family protein [Planctomycetes bacterium]|nr:zinc-dependent alcohol dehydrogenase family protein [Planctomycetota bacterium]
MSRYARAVRLRQFGGPEVLQVETVHLPDPGPREVILQVEWIGLNRAEILYREGSYLVKPELPAPMGMEGAGVVVEVGEEVTRLSPGDRVGVIPGTFDVRKYGCYGDCVALPADALVPTPPELEGPEAGAVWMAYLTAWGGLLDAGGLYEGWTVVIPAASSACGIAAIQIARREGARPIAVTTHAEKVERLKEIGAGEVIISTSEDLARRVLELTGGRGAELFFDPVGGAWLEKEIACAAPGGRIVLYGILDPRPLVFEPRFLIGRGLRMEGYFLPSTTRDPQRLGLAVQYIAEGIGEGALRPVIAKVYPLSQIQEAHRFLESGKQIGKVMVQV